MSARDIQAPHRYVTENPPPRWRDRLTGSRREAAVFALVAAGAGFLFSWWLFDVPSAKAAAIIAAIYGFVLYRMAFAVERERAVARPRRDAAPPPDALARYAAHLDEARRLLTSEQTVAYHAAVEARYEREGWEW